MKLKIKPRIRKSLKNRKARIYVVNSKTLEKITKKLRSLNKSKPKFKSATIGIRG